MFVVTVDMSITEELFPDTISSRSSRTSPVPNILTSTVPQHWSCDEGHRFDAAQAGRVQL